MITMEKLSDAEVAAWIITRRSGVKAINEAVEILNGAKHSFTFSPFNPVQMLEERRWSLCREIRDLEAIQKSRAEVRP